MNIQNTFYIVEHVLQNPDAKASDIAVFFSLLIHMGNKGYCYPSVDTIARETGYSDRAVQLSTRRLEKLGYISKIYRKGFMRQYTNYYCLAKKEWKLPQSQSSGKVKDFILQDKEFMKFVANESKEINKNYKMSAFNFIERNLDIDKRENTFLMYCLLLADKEAFAYFTVEDIAKKLSMAKSRIYQIIESLDTKEYFNCIHKQIAGKELFLIRINVESLNYKALIREKIVEILRTKNNNFDFPNEKDNVFNIQITILMRSWGKIYLNNSIMKKSIAYQLIFRHVLFNKQDFSP